MQQTKTENSKISCNKSPIADIFIYKLRFGFAPVLFLCTLSTISDIVNEYFSRYGEKIIIVLTKPEKFTRGSWVDPSKNQLYGFGFSEDI